MDDSTRRDLSAHLNRAVYGLDHGDDETDRFAEACLNSPWALDLKRQVAEARSVALRLWTVADDAHAKLFEARDDLPTDARLTELNLILDDAVMGDPRIADWEAGEQ